MEKLLNNIWKKMNKVTVDLDLDKKNQIIEVNGQTYKIERTLITESFCACGCGEKVEQPKIKLKEPKLYFNAACRTRAYRMRLES